MGSVTEEEMKGTAYILSYSGFLTVEEDKIFERLSGMFDGFEVVLESPLRISKPTWRPIPQFDDESLRAIIPATPPGVSALRISAHPMFRSGDIGFNMYWGDDKSHYASLPKDTFVVHVYGKDHDRLGSIIAQELVSRVLKWLSILSQQWWIGRSSEALTGNLHLALPMIDYGHIQGAPVPHVKQTTASRRTCVISPEMWAEAFEKSIKRIEPDIGDVLLVDAQYSFFSGNILLLFISVCSSFELMRDDVLSRRRTVDSSFKSSDLLVHMSKGFEKLIGRNLEKEQPEKFAFVKACWVARGHVAHGKNLYWNYNGKSTNFSQVDVGWFFEEVRAVQAWLRSL